MAMNTIKEYLASAKNERERKIKLKQIKDNLAKENKKYHSMAFTGIRIPEGLDDVYRRQKILQVLRDNKYFVQVYDQEGHIRISVNRAEIDDKGDWLQGISWDTLMEIKRQIGYGDFDAVEVYPKDKDVVNVANMRHLFILDEPLDFIWRSKKGIEK
jgi:hypothetical protein